MNAKQQLILKYQIERGHNFYNQELDNWVYILHSKTPITGTTLLMPDGTVATRIDIKVMMSAVLANVFPNLNKFVTWKGYHDIDLEQMALTYTKATLDANLVGIHQDITVVNNGLLTLPVNPKVADLIAIADSINSAIPHLPQTVFTTSEHHSLIVNDLMDAASYACRGINPNDGTPLSVDFRTMAKKYITTAGNYSTDLDSDVVHIKNMLDGNENLTVIADTIDSSIPKLPLLRRIWAYGG